MSNSALINDASVISLETEVALDSPGYVLTLGSTAGTVTKVPADSGRDKVVGVALTDSKDIDGTAQSDVKVGVIVQRGTVVYLKLDDNNLEISVNDPLCVDASVDGVVDKRDGATNTADAIAIALEAKSANAGGLIKALFIG